MDKSLVSKATADSAEPTPGYMFNEIARITHASVDACLQLENFLLKRLKKEENELFQPAFVKMDRLLQHVLGKHYEHTLVDEISEGFCRYSAIRGCTYMLNKQVKDFREIRIDVIEIDEDDFIILESIFKYVST